MGVPFSKKEFIGLAGAVHHPSASPPVLPSSVRLAIAMNLVASVDQLKGHRDSLLNKVRKWKEELEEEEERRGEMDEGVRRIMSTKNLALFERLFSRVGLPRPRHRATYGAGVRGSG